ncbi:MAG: hypothetical protein ACLSHV_03560 [Hominisplanchenecus sp.]
MDLDIGRLVLTAAIIFLPMYFFQKLADWSTANQKSIADLSVAFCNIVCYIKKVIAIIEGKKISDKQRRIRKDIREH